MENIQTIEVTPENLNKYGMFCNKNPKSKGYQQKAEWYTQVFEQGLRMNIALNEKDEKVGFMEYVPAEFAWRPVYAPGYMFIHCMFIYPNKNKNRGYGSQLIQNCENYTKKIGLKGVAVMTSNGAWITNKKLFVKNGYEIIDKNGRFELCVKKLDKSVSTPKLLKWQENTAANKGWSLMYSDQCPWNFSSAEAMSKVAKEQGIDLKVSKIVSAKEAQNAPTGFGVFNLLKDKKEIEDHYISKTRFLNILEKEK